MLETQLMELISRGEGSALEFKRDAADLRPETVAREVVSFANMNGGVILLGVEDNGEISGISRANMQEWLFDTVVGRHVSPVILLDYEEVQTASGTVAVVEVPRGVAKPYARLAGGREEVFVRLGSICKVAGREQLLRLYESGGFLAAEKFPVHGSTVADLDMRRVREYFVRKLKFEEGEDLTHLLRMHELLVDSGGRECCSFAAYVLFGQAPQNRLPQAGARFIVYEGAEIEHGHVIDEYLNMPFVGYSDELTGSVIVPALHDNPLFRQFLSRETFEGTTRVRRWDYPPEALREAVVNALVHRDWTRQKCVHITAFCDRLEICSPGALPNGLNEQKIASGMTLYRNGQVARVMRDYGYMEERGMGIRNTIIPRMREVNGVMPEFIAEEEQFTVVLRKRGEGVPRAGG